MNRRTFIHSIGVTGVLSTALAPNLFASMNNTEKTTDSRGHFHFETIRLDLSNPWTIARGTAEFKENVFVSYERDGITGMGEAGHLTAAGQTAAQTSMDLGKLKDLYETHNPWHFFELAAQASQLDACAPARAAAEMALVDWIGKASKLPVYRLFGLNETRTVPTSFSIGMDTPETMRKKTQDAKGFHVLKVKLGHGDDRAIIKTLREVTQVPIRVDINEGWKDREEAIHNIEWLAKQGVELVEQPMPKERLEDALWLKKRSPLPLVADEAACNAEEIVRIAEAYHGVNIKIMKTGGGPGRMAGSSYSSNFET